MSGRRILVTGGSGFIGSALVKALLRRGETVRVLDDNSRGHPRRLSQVARDIELISGDIRDAAAVDAAMRGIDEVHHLAFVNGTEFFYTAPELVLDVGVRGMINVIDACRRHGIGTLLLASSSEVYQTPPKVPTDEAAPLAVPDPLNPRYSYGAGKLISEIMAINFGRKHFERVLIFRPHNVYGADMGFEHVLPQFTLRLRALAQEHPQGRLRFPIQGSGTETRRQGILMTALRLLSSALLGAAAACVAADIDAAQVMRFCAISIAGVLTIGLMTDTLRAVFESQVPGVLNSVAASAARTRDEWEAVFAGTDSCVEPVLSVDELEHHPQHRARALFFRLGEHQQVRTPLARPNAPHTPPPQLGQHTDAVLISAGFTPTEIAALRATKAAR